MGSWIARIGKTRFLLEYVSLAFNYIELKSSVECNNTALNTIDKVINCLNQDKPFNCGPLSLHKYKLVLVFLLAFITRKYNF